MIIMLLYQIVVYTIVKKMRMSCKTNKFEITVPTWNKELHLPGGGSYSVPNIKDYFQYIIKNYENNADNPPIRINVNKIGNRVTFEIKLGYYVELLTFETIKLFKTTKNKINQNESNEI